MKFKRSNAFFAIVIIVIGIIWLRTFWFSEVFHTHKANERNRTALVQIQDDIAIGASYEQVLTAYWKHRTGELKLFAEDAANWNINMPLELGANDWTLKIQFQDGKASLLRIRTLDGGPPKDGPKDKQEIAESHIDENVPAENDFRPFLIRDLTAYLKPAHGKMLEINYELLRSGATQTGVAYPKFYLWVKATDAQKNVIEGAVKVAAIDKNRFEVVAFIPRADIISDSNLLSQIFPQALIEKIIAKAKAAQ